MVTRRANLRNANVAGAIVVICFIRAQANAEPVWKKSDFDPNRPIAALSHDGKLLLVGSAKPDQGIAIWDVKKQENVGALTDGRPTPRALAISPDDKYCVSVGNGAVLWDLNKQVVAGRSPIRGNALYSLAFSGPSECIVSTNLFRRIRIPEMKVVEFSRASEDPPLITKTSPSGRLLVGCGTKPYVQIWDVKSWKAHDEVYGHEKRIRDIAFSKSGNYFASSSDDGDLRIYQCREGETTPSFTRLHRIEIESVPWALEWNPTAPTLFVSTQKGTIEIWDGEKGVQRGRIELPEKSGIPVRLFCVSDGSMLIAMCGNRQLCFAPLDKK